MRRCASSLHPFEVTILIVWISIQIGLFIYAYTIFDRHGPFTTVRGLVGPTLPLAKAFAVLINFNTSLLLLPVCKSAISWLQGHLQIARIVSLRRSILFHKILGISILGFSLSHTICHYVNIIQLHKRSFGQLNGWKLLCLSPTSLTGHGLLLILVLIAITALCGRIKQLNFEIFWFTHMVGCILYFGLLFIHGAFCLIKADKAPHCMGPYSWMWIIPSLTCYLIEWIYQETSIQQNTRVLRVILHQSGVFELVFQKDNVKFQSGQYLNLMVPSVSTFQWHPFTLTSAPEESVKSIHIKVTGDWTKRIAAGFGIIYDDNLKLMEISTPKEMPKILLAGPFGCSLSGFLYYNVTILIGAGIGQTPFASILKSIWYNLKHATFATKQIKIEKVMFFGVCRNSQSFEWFHDILKEIEDEDSTNMFEINCYMTGPLIPEQIKRIANSLDQEPRDLITGLKSPTYYGRPNFKAIIEGIPERFPNKTVGMFYCGPAKLGDSLSRMAKLNSSDRCKLAFHQENF